MQMALRTEPALLIAALIAVDELRQFDLLAFFVERLMVARLLQLFEKEDAVHAEDELTMCECGFLSINVINLRTKQLNKVHWSSFVKSGCLFSRARLSALLRWGTPRLKGCFFLRTVGFLTLAIAHPF
jgi:hypothetical protein